jgi:hypothetical protein
MDLLKHRRTVEHKWQLVLIVIAICSLTLSVATRFWSPCTSQSYIVKSLGRRPAQPARQHLDRDASKWIAPNPDLSLIEPGTIEIRSVPASPQLPKHLFIDSLYNRPPPSSGFLLSSVSST